MTSLSEICSKCHENGMNCHCENFHPNVQPTYEFTIEELRALYRVLEHEYLPYDDLEVHKVVSKIMNIVTKNGK